MSIEEVKSNPSYSLLLVLGHDEMIPFIADQFKKKPMVVRLYLGVNILLGILLVAFAALDISEEKIAVEQLILRFFTVPILSFFALVILHESLHGLAYWLVGAQNISFGANWRKCYFYAVADQFVTKRDAFLFVALLPFVVISVLVMAPMPFVDVHWKWSLLGVLFLHTAACSGDFAMLGFYERYRSSSELITFDDVSEKRSYFFVKE